MEPSENTTSNASAPATHNEQSMPALNTTAMRVSLTVILISMIILTVLGNALVLIATWQDKRLHQPNKYLIVCLAVADLLVGIFSVPIRLYLHFNSRVLVSVHLCRFWAWIDVFAEAASIFTLTFISIDRYHKISKPLQYKSQMTTSRSIIVICFIWLISAAFATLGLFSYGSSRGIEAIVGVGCINDNKIYFTIAAGVSFFVPALITVAMYILIFYIAHKRQKMARNGRLGQSFSAASDVNRGSAFLQDLKIIRMLCLVVCTFILCWGPFFTISVLMSYKKKYMITLGVKNLYILGKVFGVILPSFNSLCNPIIYACFDREYSKAFKHLFQRMLCLKTPSRTNMANSKYVSKGPSGLSNNDRAALRIEKSSHTHLAMVSTSSSFPANEN